MGERVTKETIVLAFLNVSFEKSAGETSLADIASYLGIKKPSLYNHYESREAIVNATVEYCRNYLNEISFIPSEIEAVVQKYPAETVLKGIVNRHFRMHEKAPLFQIFTFLQSMQFFLQPVQDIIDEQTRKLVQQTEIVLYSLKKAEKITVDDTKIHRVSQWFCSALNDLLRQHLQIRKQIIRDNPQSGEGELFPLPDDDHNMERINAMVESFTVLL